jgi:hypothetical protein
MVGYYDLDDIDWQTLKASISIAAEKNKYMKNAAEEIIKKMKIIKFIREKY